jgi:hypothetical protein
MSRLPNSSSVILAIVLQAASAAAEPDFICGTGPQTSARARAVASFAAARARSSFAAFEGVQTLHSVDGITVMSADDTLAPYFAPLDLSGMSLLFTPRDATTYAVSRGSAFAETDIGAELPLLGSPAQARVSPMFPVRVFDRTLTELYISRFNSIHGAPAAAPDFWQYDVLEAVSQRDAVVSPLLMTASAQRLHSVGIPKVYVRNTAAFLAVTWTTATYDVRATIFPDGRVLFSYVRFPEGADGQFPGAVIVTSGSEPWRTSVINLADSGHVPGGVDPSVPPPIAPLLDITRLRVDRVNGFDLLRCEITLAAVPDSGTYTVTFEGRPSSLDVRVLLRDGAVTLGLPRAIHGFVEEDLSAAARLDGKVLSIHILDESLGFVPDRVSVRSQVVKDNFAYSGDLVRSGFSYSPPARNLVTDFDRVRADGQTLSAIVEAFTRPTVNLEGVWQRLRNAFGLSDERVDAVAVYQNFATDTDFFASAYACCGSSGAGGTGDSASSPLEPRQPTLLQMNRTFFEPVMPVRNTALLHEFGHRFLFYPGYRDQSGLRDDLNPDGSHPAQWVDTRTAFRVESDFDCSVMGGAVFAPNADGSFAIALRFAFGYTWLELYLMGLASAAEVRPFFYIANSQPPLGQAYWPPAGLGPVRGNRIDVNVGQIIAVVGPRVPAYPTAPKHFYVAFVLLRDPSRAASMNDIAGVAWARETLVRDFSAATGGRGSVLPTPPELRRRRSVRH